MLKKPLLVVLAASKQHPNEYHRAIEEHAAETWDDAFKHLAGFTEDHQDPRHRIPHGTTNIVQL